MLNKFIKKAPNCLGILIYEDQVVALYGEDLNLKGVTLKTMSKKQQLRYFSALAEEVWISLNDEHADCAHIILKNSNPQILAVI